ncbi:peptidoglycan-binding domain-containing protein [Streptomyces sp. NBC_00588]|uniref:peptidoglycan-binding domain-containing protein n=1 Tax=Streptomyces sp. NBC_00588 TaxID=2975784 RepID=UPI002E806DD2|nr:peptidoglycan-binding domain-containing protein [Streptomyces sp. NBC_00588]WUB33631.1 peptidoglycan-binding protein [Streptomyces sp. NBC_00588]
MALTRLTKTLLGTLTAAALGIGTLTGATAATAAPAQQASNQTVTIQAVNNLGLNTAEAKSAQCYVRDAAPVGKYNPGAIDGRLGTNSWKAWQLFLNDRGHNAGTVDGVVGPNTIRGLQRFLVSIGYDTGGIDGVAGTKTRAAWKAFANLGGGWC